MDEKIAECRELLVQQGERVPCPVWQAPQARRRRDWGTRRDLYYSPRAGGVFRGEDIEDYRFFSSRKHDSKGTRIKLSRWVYDKNQLGEISCLTSDEIERIDKQERLKIDQRLGKLLQCFATIPSEISEGLSAIGLIGVDASDESQIIQAATECSAGYRYRSKELNWLISAAVESGWLRRYRDSPKHIEHIRLTPTGVKRLEEMETKLVDSAQAFVAMWFHDSLGGTYEDGIEPAIRNSGYRPLRIDKKEHNGKIDDEIMAEIRRSRFIVCDFTCELVENERTQTAVPRGGVYYEAGFAQGLGIPVIWTCREDHIEYVHFDTRQFNHITRKTPEDLRERLKNRIAAVIGDGPLRGAG